MKSIRTSFVLLILALLGAPAAHAGWSWTMPPGYVIPTSAKRNHVFYEGEPVQFTAGAAATRYEVRDYYGEMVDQGQITGSGSPRNFTISNTHAGWFKLYLHGAQDQGEPWGSSVGGTTFVVFRQDANFPPLPPRGTSGGYRGSDDEVIRGITGMGPQRLKVDDASKPSEAIAKLEADVALLRLYTPVDPRRPSELLIAFPNGTDNVAGVTQIVTRFKNEVRYWEGRNEPDHFTSGANFALTQMKTFYDTVKAVDPTLKVIGPGITSITPRMSPWIAQFLQYGRGKFDVFSFHAYNCTNGDPWLLRQSLTDLQVTLDRYGVGSIEKWQTEQGYFAAFYGVYQPRLQGRWTMLQMMFYEQFGIPKEQNHLWYDRSHGFWDFPTWWENEDGSLNPAAALMRVWSEELFGTNFVRAYNFGEDAKHRHIGSLFAGPGKSVATFMSGGNPHAVITLAVTGGPTLRVIGPFGDVSQVVVQGGTARLPISELPTYVELAAGQTCEVVPQVLGENLARRAGVTIQASGQPEHPQGGTIPNGTAKLVNGKFENWYYTQVAADHPWMSNVTTWPATVEFTLPEAESISDVILYAGVPWQSMSTLLDYELQYWNGAAWVTIERVIEPPKTFKVYTPPVRCSVDSFFSDRWIFEHRFAPVTTNRIRLLVHDVTHGGGATADVVAAGGQTGPRQIVLREVEIRKATGPTPPRIVQAPTGFSAVPGSDAILNVTTTGDGPLSYAWTKNGKTIPGAGGPQLTLAAVDLSSQGSYTVTVTNSAGSDVSLPALVTVSTPFSQWVATRFPANLQADPRALFFIDLDGDGINTLMEYFFNLRAPDGSVRSPFDELPRIAPAEPGDAGFIFLRYEVNPEAGDVAALVETTGSPDASPWRAVTPDTTEWLGTNPTTGNTIVRLKMRVDHPTSQFFRLKLLPP